VTELRRAAPFLAIALLVALAGCTLLGLPSTERAPLALELQNAEARCADSIEATFDPELGYPVGVSVNPVEDMFDDEFAFEIRDLEALP
jgi:hypothetical protein